MAENNCSDIVDSLMKGMEAVLVGKTVVGDAVHVDDTIILPLVDISFGVGAGASLSKEGVKNGAGGGGLSGKMSPSAVLVIKNGTTKLVNVKNQDALTKIIDLVPDVIDKFTGSADRKSMPKDDECVDAAFGNDDE